MQETKTAGGIVVNSNGYILVVSQRGTSWSLPKGRVDAGEDEQAAAIREIEEESGVKSLVLIKNLGTYRRYKIGKYGGEDPSELKEITIFLFTTKQKSLEPQDPFNPEARWVKPDQVEALLTHPKDKAFYKSVRNEVGNFIKHR